MPRQELTKDFASEKEARAYFEAQRDATMGPYLSATDNPLAPVRMRWVEVHGYFHYHPMAF